VSTLVVGVGNTLRGDDGAAALVLERLAARAPGAVSLRLAHCLLPELAAEMVGYERVVIVDADVSATAVVLAPLDEGATRGGLHDLSPGRLVGFARALGFQGEAQLCRLPIETLEAGAPLSARASAAAEEAVALLLARPLGA
jgi:hydrogenase maturation protease